MRKKRVLFHSDFSLAKTGFGRAMKALLCELYKTDKYEIHHLCCGLSDNAKELQLTPWKSHGSVPSDQRKLSQIQSQNSAESRTLGYGSSVIDECILSVKPDIYIGVQDFWGVDYTIDKNWFKKINTCLWITLDSLPLLPSAVKRAKDIPNYWVWSNFAEKEMKRLAFPHVKTVHGPINDEKFFRLSDEDRKILRKANNLPEDAIIIGFVFRNQLRKLVPNLMEGYKLWKDAHPELKNTYLLLHTNFSEGWNIKAQAEIHNINTKEILTTYICRNCQNYEVKTFDDRENKFKTDERGQLILDENGKQIENNLDPQNKNCKICGTNGSQVTTNVSFGVSEAQLNEVYNLMDVYVHPFTSGGQEIPIQEAKLTELITLVTNYSCGEECCEPEANSLALDWAKYLEHGTEFIKASTYPSSIKEKLDIFLKMSESEKREMGRKARQWTIKNFSSKNVSKQVQNFLDSCQLIDENNENLFKSQEVKNLNPDAKIDANLLDKEWIKSLYQNILGRESIDETDEGFQYWMNELGKKTERNDIENYFRQTALKDLSNDKQIKFEDILDKQDKGKRILYVMPESIGDIYMSTALFENIKAQYPQHNLYVATKPEYFEILHGNQFIHKTIQYIPQMDQILWLEGAGEHEGFFDLAFLPHAGTQRFLDYIHNGKTKIQFDIKDNKHAST